MTDQYIREILNSRVYDVAVQTPLTPASQLSRKLQNRIYIKREDLQSVFSFKIRGAYNRMAQLTDDEKSCGVVAASAGNHAQGVAYAARKLGISAKIVMPLTTPEIKVSSVRERGAEVVLFGDKFDDALREAKRLEHLEGRIFIHPYDDPLVIAGQGTVGMEIMRQAPEPIDAIFVPVGGGGLAAGIAVFVKYLRRDVKIIAVESEESASLKAAFESGERVVLPKVGIFADGVAVAQVGVEPFRLLRDLVDDIITVSNDEVCAAIRDLFQETRTIAEPSGAVALAGLKKYVEQESVEDQSLVAVMSGANVDFKRLRFISERAEVGENKEGLFAVSMPERPGAFKNFIDLLDGHNITEFNYRYADAKMAQIFFGVDLRNGSIERQMLCETFRHAGYDIDDLTQDDLVKDHIRSMIGGHLPSDAQPETLYKLDFPERSGALGDFLQALRGRWNLSLFHYRNRGGVIGQVLVALQVPESERGDAQAFFEQLGFPFSCIAETTAYTRFLR